MVRKYFILLVIAFCFCLTDVHASSINYDLRIDKYMEFYETITYNISNSDIKSGEYSFLTSIVNDKVYFNENNGVEYTKVKKKTSNGYVVKLTHEYSSGFFENSRIAKECFSSVTLTNDTDGIEFSSSSPFFCSHRADSITVNITTDLTVTNSNATSVNGNKYTWTNLDNDFSLKFSTRPITIESDTVLDNDDGTGSDVSNNSDNDTTNTNSENTETKKGISASTIVIIIIVILLFSVSIFLLLNARSKSVNKL